MRTLWDILRWIARKWREVWRATAPRQMGWRKGIACRFLLLLPAIWFVLSYMLIPVLHWSSARTVTVVVEDRYIKHNPDNGREQYLVRLAGEETTMARVEDTWLWMRFDASNRYSQLTQGARVRVKLAGMRLEFFSMYPNVVNVEPVLSGTR